MELLVAFAVMVTTTFLVCALPHLTTAFSLMIRPSARSTSTSTTTRTSKARVAWRSLVRTMEMRPAALVRARRAPLFVVAFVASSACLLVVLLIKIELGGADTLSRSE